MLNHLIKNMQPVKGAHTKETNWEKRWSPISEHKQFVLDTVQDPLSVKQQQFLDQLTAETIQFLTESRGLRAKELAHDKMCTEQMVDIVNRLYRTLEVFSFQLNAALGFAELRTCGTRPNFVTETTKLSRGKDPVETLTKYRARMGTAYWSLVIRGDQNCIDVFLLPSSKVVGLSVTEALYKPLHQVRSRDTQCGIVWQLDGKRAFVPSLLDEFCMHIFATLIHQTKSQIQANHHLETAL